MVSFVTRDQLVVFDPHGTHLPGGLLGLRCNFVEKGLRDSHPAQAAPFVWQGESALPFCDADLRKPLPPRPEPVAESHPTLEPFTSKPALDNKTTQQKGPIKKTHFSIVDGPRSPDP